MTISADFPFTKQKAAVLGSNIAYIDVGSSPSYATLFLHGSPTSSYLWRNVIPHVSPKSRCIAPDLIGFGDSDKVSGLEYRFVDHQRYLDEFIDAVLPTEKITLVVHDWGAALGFDWARRNESRVAGVAFMEFVTPPQSRDVFRVLQGGVFQDYRSPELGRKLLVDQNEFIEKFLPDGIVRKLSEKEMAEYRRPFLDPASREPLWRFPNEIPAEGEPADVWEIAQKYMAWLMSCEVPKLFFSFSPGAIIPEGKVDFLLGRLKNTKNVFLGKGIHFVQEDHPHELGSEIALWLPEL